MVLSSSLCDFNVCAHLMFSKFQIENKGGKVEKGSDDVLLDDKKFKVWYNNFKNDPKNEKQVETIEQLKEKQGLHTDEAFLLGLIEEGERFNIIDTQVQVDFQIEIDTEQRNQFKEPIQQMKRAFLKLAANKDEGAILVPDFHPSNIQFSDSDSETENENEA